jgi:ribonuclease Z
MIPREPARRPQLGFLYVPPYRVQGLSIAGEESVVQVPELGVCFDIGRCPRAVLPSSFVALTHGHMDHSAGIAYYFSQRVFQGMGTGKLVVHPALEQPVHNLMRAWVDIEAQRTPYQVIALAPDGEIGVKNHTFLRAFATNHTVPSLGFVIVERRSKLRADLVGLTQEQLIELKKKGENITQTLEIPLVCYTGDTMWGPHFDRPDVLNAKVLITECTFTEPDHRDRAAVGKHLHLMDVVELLKRSKAEAVILTHLSRRTHIGNARKQIESALDPADRGRLHILMDGRANRARYDQQAAEAGGVEPEAAGEEAAG